MTITQENGSGIGATRYCQIGDAVMVEVSARDAAWTRAHSVRSNKERAIAPAQQGLDVIISAIHYCDIKFAVAV
jgi:hypothetical protein